MRAILDKFLDGILHGANLYAYSRGSGNHPTKTIKVSDVLHALAHAGLPALGFDDSSKAEVKKHKTKNKNK